MLVFDKWTCNTNGRQTVFFNDQGKAAEQAVTRYKTKMIDQGFCFNAGEWNFPDAPLRGLYALDEITRAIPPEWYADDYDALLALLEQLHRRRHRVPDLILEAKRCNRQPFPNWT
jgi:hypothetical protein